ncbi:hypothetical protein Pma05_84580 [Plantactinospora mayteni]|uniref:Uncharacterized protein n=1 Tax=Plantactinospora mayteni TaxID=566021 RepID=A0ABQ4F4P5_9ACTN|nr:hypothetical protein Pma05_84580 [Plantactinospora mayteni]
MQLLSARSARDYQSRVLQHPQMLGDAEPGHHHLGLQRAQRPPVPDEQQVEQEPSGRIGERLENKVIIAHHPKIGDRKVTCQGSQADALLACDFLETMTLFGARMYVLAVIEYRSRRIRILCVTAHPARRDPSGTLGKTGNCKRTSDSRSSSVMWV